MFGEERSTLFPPPLSQSWERGAALESKLDKGILDVVSALLRDYEACLSRIRAYRVPVQSKGRKNDVERILFSRGQEDDWDADELYAQLGAKSQNREGEIRCKVSTLTKKLFAIDN